MDGLPESIECRRSLLRRWRVDDATALGTAIGESLDHLRPWMAWAALEPLTVEERRAGIERWNAASGDGDGIYGIFVDGAVVGGCGLHRRGAADTLEIGYWIHVDHVGCGYATDAAAALTSAAFDVPGIVRVTIHHDRANVASGRVPARLGFACDGESPDEIVAPGESGVDVAWSMAARNWSG